jgi:hypothetical protein
MVSPAKFAKIEAGVEAWKADDDYHRNSKKKPRVYHTDNECSAGLKIELRHLRAGRRGRACRKCP